MTGGKKLYMIVSSDEYEFPEVIGESVEEVARITGRSVKSLRVCFSKGRHCEKYDEYFRRYVTVEVDE